MPRVLGELPVQLLLLLGARVPRLANHHNAIPHHSVLLLLPGP